MLHLRDYQTDLIAKARASMRAGHRRVCLQASTGAGKTVLIAQMLAQAAAKGSRSWFLVHRTELLEQSVDTFVTAADIHTGIIAAGFQQTPLAPVQVCSVPSLARRLAHLAPPDLLVFDECFVAGTLIDGIPIEQIRSGDIVRTWNEKFQCFDWQRVGWVQRTSAPNFLYRISANGRTVVCTGNHPFMLANGEWRDARDLEKGVNLFGVSSLRETHCKKQQPSATLQDVLPNGDGRAESPGRAGQDARTEPDARRDYASANDSDAQGHRASAARTWRQRYADTRARTLTRLGAWLALRSRGADWRAWWAGWALDALQTRYWKPGRQARNRDRWWLAPLYRATTAGPEEGAFFSLCRVDRVEILQRGSDGRFEEVCPDGYVYNFETEHTHTYIANGLVVHNCHHIAATTWASVAVAFPGAFHIGLTATPERLDRRGLKAYFDDLICGPSTADLIARGYLAPYVLYAPTLTGPDLGGVHTTAGEYNKKELARAMDNSTIVGDAVQHYGTHAPGARALVFMWSVESSKAIAQRFIEAGVPAEHVDGETPRADRLARMARFRSGETRVLCNVELFSEGVDVPACDAVFLCRPTQSLGLYLQQVGRGLRMAPGKAAVKVFDHAGNWTRHGLPDAPREWTLEDTPKKKKAPPGGRRCVECHAISKAGAAVCVACGVAFVVTPRDIKVANGTLEEWRRTSHALAPPRLVSATSDDKHSLAYWTTMARQRGYKHGWAFFAWKRFLQQVTGRRAEDL